jgi:hypothetical protein
MSRKARLYRFILPMWGIFSFLPAFCSAIEPDTGRTSTLQQAIEFIDKIKELEPSIHWPNIKAASFLENLKLNIHQPLSIYPGSGTNFCGYGALTYLFLQDDPLGYAKILLQLYKEGQGKHRDVSLNPSDAVKKAAGRLRFKGTLDVRPAEQLWYLTLAGHYKGYLNIINRRYNFGDENTFWASVNYAKFNRMVRTLLNYKTKARGADIMRPGIKNLYEYVSKRMKNGIVVLYMNNRIVHKKNHTVKLKIPTHFIIAEKISMENGLITFVYWDYGHKTLMQMTPSFFKSIIFGVTLCTKKENDDD